MKTLPTIILLSIASTCLSLEIQVIQQWNLFDFNFPYDYDLLNNFRPENSIPTGFDMTEDRIFVSIPRLRSGVPASLAVLPRNSPPGSSPRLQAYPDWSFHETGRNVTNPSCSGIISVYRTRQDSCGRLWVLDAGVTTSLEDFRVLCMPKILIVDLNTDQIIRTVVFPRQVLRPNSLLTNLVLDETTGSCDSAFAYITDTAAPGLVVYNSANDSAWRIIHPSMYPDPDFSDHTVQGETFTLMDAVIGIAHSPKLGIVYFQPLATDRIFSIPTAALRKGPPAELEQIPISLLGRKASQGIPLVLDPRDDTLYFSPLSETSVASFNVISGQQKLIAYDPERLQFPSEMRWFPSDSGAIWALSTRFQKFFRRTLSPNETNLRIIRIPLSPTLSHGFGNNIYFRK